MAIQTKQKQELELWNRYKMGNEDAKRELLYSLKPVINSQVSKFRTSGLPVPAIELEGFRLTAKALDTYDPQKAQLNTHVINNLKKLSRFVTSYQNIGHIPEPRALMIGKYNATYQNLKDDLNREPTILELADNMHVPPIEIERLQTELRKDLSLELPTDDEDEIGFYMYTRPEDVDPKKKQALDFVYFDVDNVDKKILEYTFGLSGTPKLKFNEIALRLKISDSTLKKRKKRLATQIKELL